jgi:uncharacterized membrane protein
METEKMLSLVSLVIAGLITLVFLLDAILGIPFGAASRVFDILIVIGGAFVIWQALETYREVA